MTHHYQNRPFYSYILTQSALVVIVLAASYLMTELLADHLGLSVDRFWLSLILIFATQVPVAMIYAKSETRDMPAFEGWILAGLFVAVSFGFEVVLQTLSGEALHTLVLVQSIATKGDARVLATVVLSGAIGLLVAVYLIKTAYAYAVRCQLKQMDMRRPASEFTKVEMIGERGKQDLSGLYRRELIAANIGIFGMSVMVFGPQFMHVLKLSVPLSIVFAVICVANQMAKRTSRQTLSARCLHIAVQMLPMTVFGLILMGASVFYAQYTTTAGTSIGVMDYSAMIGAFLATSDGMLGQLLLALGLIFALCLAANTLMLVLFARLIRPLVRTAHKTRRPIKIIREPFETPNMDPVVASFEKAKEAAPIAAEKLANAFRKGSELRMTLPASDQRTVRPEAY